MDKIRLQNTIESLSKLVSVDENKKNELIERFSLMNDAEAIKELSTLVYRTLGTNDDYYNYALTVIRNINPEICPPVEEMKSILSKIFSFHLTS